MYICETLLTLYTLHCRLSGWLFHDRAEAVYLVQFQAGHGFVPKHFKEVRMGRGDDG